MSVIAGRSLPAAMPAGADFPSWPPARSRISSCASRRAKRLIDRTQFAISTEETRYYLNGIFFHTIEAGKLKLRAVATDGHRLARAEMEAPAGSEACRASSFRARPSANFRS